LRSCTRQSLTASGTLLPISDLIRMARHAYRYLAIFRGHDERPLCLGRTKRIATADQRIILHANGARFEVRLSLAAEDKRHRSWFIR